MIFILVLIKLKLRFISIGLYLEKLRSTSMLDMGTYFETQQSRDHFWEKI